MNNPAIANNRRNLLFVWAGTATVIALLSVAVAVLLWLRLQPDPSAASGPSSPFLALSESAIPGRYKWVSKSGAESFMRLNADHTFTKEDGPSPAHRWELTPDALVIHWVRSRDQLNRIEQPGVYIGIKDGGETVRLEKQE